MQDKFILVKVSTYRWAVGFLSGVSEQAGKPVEIFQLCTSPLKHSDAVKKLEQLRQHGFAPT
jgi:hypothetical protein